MNIFEQYGIKEVCDVTLYAIELDKYGDEVYIPIIYLDSLKVSTLEQTAESVSARGGRGNAEQVIWDFGKTINVKIDDALFSPASQSLMWGSYLGIQKAKIKGVVTKISLENDKKADLIIQNFGEFKYNNSLKSFLWNDVDVKIVCYDNLGTYYKENLNIEIERYDNGEYQLLFVDEHGSHGVDNFPLGDGYFFKLKDTKSNSLDTLFFPLKNGIKDVEVLERMEKLFAKQEFAINTDANMALFNYKNDPRCYNKNLEIYIDPKTLQPYEPSTDFYAGNNGKFRIIKQYDMYYKWTRTVAEKYSTLGRQIVIDAEHFSGAFKFVGETWIRSRDDGKDQRYQIEIPLCKVTSNTNLILEAAGDPTVFSMELKVLQNSKNEMVKLTQYLIDNKNEKSNDTYIVPIEQLHFEKNDVMVITRGSDIQRELSIDSPSNNPEYKIPVDAAAPYNENGENPYIITNGTEDDRNNLKVTYSETKQDVTNTYINGELESSQRSNSETSSRVLSNDEYTVTMMESDE